MGDERMSDTRLVQLEQISESSFPLKPTAVRELIAEVRRLRALFYDAGQGEHNVLALVDHYQASAIEAEARVRAVEAERDALADRICTIADEDSGPHPVISADEALTLIEWSLFVWRQRVVKVEAERDALKAALRALVDASGRLDASSDPDQTDVLFTEWRATVDAARALLATGAAAADGGAGGGGGEVRAHLPGQLPD